MRRVRSNWAPSDFSVGMAGYLRAQTGECDERSVRADAMDWVLCAVYSKHVYSCFGVVGFSLFTIV